MSRSILQHRRWHLIPDQEPDAEPTNFRMQCAVCEALSPSTEDVTDAQQWTLQHAGRNPSHLTYRELISRPWRTWMQ